MALVYLAVGFGFMIAGGLLFGGVFFGLHPMITLSGSTVGVWHGLGLILLSCLYALAAMACIVSMALLFSALTDSSLTALIATIVLPVSVLLAFIPFYLLGFTGDVTTPMITSLIELMGDSYPDLRDGDFASRFVLFSSRASSGGGPYVVEATYPLAA